MSDPGEFALFLAVGGALVTMMLGPIGQALGRRLSRGKQADPATGLTTGEMTAERVAMLEERVADLEAERAQLEERLDFAERLLAQAGKSGESMGRLGRVEEPAP
jgi:hypothetical protein